MNSINNRHLLLALVGLGVFNALLCFGFLLRENGNGVRIAHLTGELQAERAKQQTQFEELTADLKKTQRELAQTREQLASACGDLRKAQVTLEGYLEKPWLNQPETQAPWEQQLKGMKEHLAKVQQDLDALKPKTLKPPPLGPGSP
jgi:septal ring factor EnvC (AmiA/AmiB activator)